MVGAVVGNSVGCGGLGSEGSQENNSNNKNNRRNSNAISDTSAATKPLVSPAGTIAGTIAGGSSTLHAGPRGPDSQYGWNRGPRPRCMRAPQPRGNTDVKNRSAPT